MENITSKVCIIGSGPGGIVTSLFLSQYKIPHLLVDKSIFPRDKVCGENMDGRVPLVLKKIDPNIVEELKAKGLVEETHDFNIILPKGTVPVSFKKDSTPRLLAKRIDFDLFLYQKASSSEYCTVIDGCAISDYRFDGDQIVFESKDKEITCNIGVVACGFQSGLLKNRKDDSQLYFFNRMYYKNEIGFPGNQVQTYYFDDPVKCCLLIVPLPNNEFNVDLGISKDDYKRLKIRLSDLFDLLINNDEKLSTWMKTGKAIDKARGVHLPITSNHKYFSDRNLLYVGASSFCVNPITGMGIGNAMVMAEIAAGEIKEYIEKNSYTANDTISYERKAKKRLKNVFILNSVINLFFKYLNYTTPVLLLIVKSKYFLRIISHTELLKNVSKPGFYLKKMFTRS